MQEVHQGLLWHCKILEDLLFYIQMHCRLRPTSALHDMTTEFCSYTAAALVYEADVDLIGLTSLPLKHNDMKCLLMAEACETHPA